jgi:hypothetical protein
MRHRFWQLSALLFLGKTRGKGFTPIPAENIIQKFKIQRIQAFENLKIRDSYLLIVHCLFDIVHLGEGELSDEILNKIEGVSHEVKH